MYKIIQKRNIWLTFSTTLAVISIIALSVWGLKLGIDFTGGSLIELQFTKPAPDNQLIYQKLADLKLDSLAVQPTGNNGILIRTVSLNEETHQEILKRINELFTNTSKNSTSTATSTAAANDAQQKQLKAALGLTGPGTDKIKIDVSGPGANLLNTTSTVATNLSNNANFVEQRFDSIGPTIGKELEAKTIYAIIIVLIAIIVYIGYAFRKVSQPVESWKYGLSATIALAHDILIVTGMYCILSHFLGFQADSLFVTALLTILGFSVHDTIVTFDRVRENLRRHQDETFENLINRSINETIIRSFNTTLTVLLVLIATFIFGGDTIREFILTLLMGFIIGTYSSIFVASPFLLIFYKLKKI